MEEYELIPILIEYKKIIDEWNGIQNDIKQYRMQFKNRLNELQNKKNNFEDMILKYLENTKEPGIKYQDCLFIKDQKKIVIKDKESEILNILQKYNVQNPSFAMEDVKKIIKFRKKKNNNKPFSIKLKKIS